MGFLKQKLKVLLLLLAMIITLCACGEKKEESTFSGTVYVPEFVSFDLGELGIEYINTGCCDGTYIYLLAEGNHEVQEVNPETGESESRFEYGSSVYRISLDGSESVELENFETMRPTEKQVDREIYSYLEGLTVDADGTLWVTESVEEYIYAVPEDFDPEIDFLWNYEMIDHRQIKVRRQLDATGKEISRVDAGSLEQAL